MSIEPVPPLVSECPVPIDCLSDVGQEVTTVKKPPPGVQPDWQVLLVAIITGGAGAPGQVPGSVVRLCMSDRQPVVVFTQA